MSENNLPMKSNQNAIVETGYMHPILQSAVPAPLPALDANTGIFGLLGANIKANQLVKYSEKERQIAINSRDAAIAKIDAIHAYLTSTERIRDTFREYDHKQKMREYEEKQQDADLLIKSLEAKKLEAETTKIGYETAIMGNEVKLGNIQFQIQELKLKEMLEEMKGNRNV